MGIANDCTDLSILGATGHQNQHKLWNKIELLPPSQN